MDGCFPCDQDHKTCDQNAAQCYGPGRSDCSACAAGLLLLPKLSRCVSAGEDGDFDGDYDDGVEDGEDGEDDDGDGLLLLHKISQLMCSCR